MNIPNQQSGNFTREWYVFFSQINDAFNNFKNRIRPLTLTVSSYSYKNLSEKPVDFYMNGIGTITNLKLTRGKDELSLHTSLRCVTLSPSDSVSMEYYGSIDCNIVPR